MQNKGIVWALVVVIVLMGAVIGPAMAAVGFTMQVNGVYRMLVEETLVNKANRVLFP